MAVKSSWVPFYTSDWLGGVAALSAQERGVYITLLAMMYERREPLTLPEDRLAVVCGCTRKALGAAVAALLEAGKLVRKNGGLWNLRAEKELQERDEKRTAAKESAEARWGKSKQKQSPPHTDAMRTQYDGNANHNHSRTEAASANAAAASAQPAAATENGAWTPDRLHSELLAAVGLNNGRIPTHWLPPGATIHAWRWHSDLGLAPERIIEAARSSRSQHPDAPRGPKALDGVMKSLVAAMANGTALPPDTAESRKQRWKRIAAR